MYLDFLKKEVFNNPEIKEKVQKILENENRSPEEAEYAAQHCNIKIFHEINLYHDKFESVKIIFDHFLEISEKTDLKKIIFYPFIWGSDQDEDLIENCGKDFVENFSKNIDYIICRLNISKDERVDIINNIFERITVYDYYKLLFLDNLFNLCKNKYEFSQEDLKKLSKTYMKEIEEVLDVDRIICNGGIIHEQSLKDLESIMKMFKNYDVPRKVFDIEFEYRPFLNYFLKHRSREIYK